MSTVKTMRKAHVHCVLSAQLRSAAFRCMSPPPFVAEDKGCSSFHSERNLAKQIDASAASDDEDDNNIDDAETVFF